MKQAGQTARIGRHALGVLLLACALLLVVSAESPAEDAAPDTDFRRFVTVRFADGTTAAQRRAARERVGARFEQSLLGANLQQVSLPSREDAGDAADELSDTRRVEYAVASGIWEADAGYPVPFDDPFYPRQWSLANYGQIYMSRFADGQFVEVRGTPGADIGAVAAWQATDSASLTPQTIGVIDTGVAWQHPDLAANIVPGHDFLSADADPRDPSGHGTHVASIAAGVADNGIGTVGVNPWARVMPLRAADAYGNFSWAAIEQAVAHGIAHGVRVFNGSFGGAENNPAVAELVRANSQALFVFSAGNNGTDHDAPFASGRRYPCDLDYANVVCVAATDPDDALAGFSDYGHTSVDLAAPGVDIYAAKPCQSPATGPGDDGECPYDPDNGPAPIGLGGGVHAFQLLSGTSMAAPAVAAALSLVWSRCPGLRPSQVKRAVVTSVRKLGTLQGRTAWGGRLDLAAAVGSVTPCPPPSDGNDWPNPPVFGDGPSTDSVGGGAPGGLPTPQQPNAKRPTSSTLSFRITRPAKARLTRRRTVKFKLRCNERCSAAIVAQPRGGGISARSTKVKHRLRPSGTRSIAVKLSKSSYRRAHALLRARRSLRLRVRVVVADADGAKARPLVFNIRLTR